MVSLKDYQVNLEIKDYIVRFYNSYQMQWHFNKYYLIEKISDRNQRLNGK